MRQRLLGYSPLTVAAFSLAVATVLAAMLGALGSRWDWWHFSTGFTIVRWAGYAAVVAAFSALAGFFWALFRKSRGGLLALGTLLISLAFVGNLYRMTQLAESLPPIHDITTDVNDAPAFVTIRELRAEAPNPSEYAGAEVARLQQEAYPDIEPVILDDPYGLAFERALDTAHRMGWELVDKDRREGRIEAVDRTFWFGFYDDVVIRLQPLDEGTRVDVRSKSRVGRHDFGTNADRIRSYFDTLLGRDIYWDIFRSTTP